MFVMVKVRVGKVVNYVNVNGSQNTKSCARVCVFQPTPF